MMKKNCVFGTAGHIDHGKSSLVKALTGTDPDRLKEEKERGITVDLGFASLETDQFHISFVDVPGHEKLVKNMIAGATGFDVCLFAVDARERVMPQTVEHANIIHTLGVKHIIVAVTKSDLLSETELQDSLADIQAFFEDYSFTHIEFIPVNIYDADRLAALTDYILSAADAVTAKDNQLPFMLRVDRSFSVKGFGTVVTGTAISGKVMSGNQLELLPVGHKVKVKGLNVHGKSVKTAGAGQRVAINLSGVDRKDVSRGDVLSEDLTLEYTHKIYAKIKVFAQDDLQIVIKHNRNYPVFIGTAHFNGKLILLNKKEITNGDSALCVIKLTEPYSPYVGEPFVLRGMSPQVTLAGGTVLAVTDYHLKKTDLCDALDLVEAHKGDAFVDMVLGANSNGFSIPPKLQFLPVDIDLNALLKAKNLVLNRQYLISESQMNAIIDQAESELKANQAYDLSTLALTTGLSGNILSVIESRLLNRAKDAGFIQVGRQIQVNKKSDFEVLCDRILDGMKSDVTLSNAAVIGERFKLEEKTAYNCVKHLHNRDAITAIGQRIYIATPLLKKVLQQIEDHCATNGFIDVKSLKTFFEAPRKITVAMLDYLDTTSRYVNKDHKRYLK